MSGCCHVELQGLCSKLSMQALQCPLLQTWDYGVGKLRSLEASSLSVENSFYHLFQFKYKRNMIDIPKHLCTGSCLSMCVFIQTYRGQGSTSSVFLNYCPPCVWRQSLAEPGTHQLDWVGSPVSSRDAPASIVQQWDCRSLWSRSADRWVLGSELRTSRLHRKNFTDWANSSTSPKIPRYFEWFHGIFP